ncbi:MAG: peptide deformylase [Erysipelotrichia bacterium]|nr:peptide deformylase [Erysipelotrichia bacterium]
MKLKILKDSNPLMKKKSLPVTLPLSKKEQTLLDNMLAYIKKSQDIEYAEKHNLRPGVGLAAVQVGVLKRMFIIYYVKGDGTVVQYQMVNPKIVEYSSKKCALSAGEGCLSVDEEHPGIVHRNYKIKMVGYDALTKQDIEVIASGYDAIVLQHEYDHLDGILFYDRIDASNPFKQLENVEFV